MITTDTIKNLCIKRKAGASVVQYRPMFSQDSESLFIIFDTKVRQYSVKTGQLIRTIENPTLHPIVSLGYNSEQPKELLACTKFGQILVWTEEEENFQVSTEILNFENIKYCEGSAIGFHISKKRVYFAIQHNHKSTYDFLCAQLSTDEKKQAQILPISCQQGDHSFSFGGESNQEFLACIRGHVMNIMDLETTKCYKRTSNVERTFTCVSAHKTEMCIATGDISGRIMLWRNFMTHAGKVKEVAPYSTYHWHSLPVADIAFTQAASHMYSGAAENVLVKWQLDSEIRKFLPRLGAPIKHVAVAPDNRFVAVCIEDNTVLVTDSRPQLVQSIQHLSFSFTAGDAASSRAGLLLDPHSKALVLNGRPGQLQFYSVENRDLLFKLDVVGQNLLSQERHAVLVNTDVSKVAVTSDGKWLATVEERDDKESHREVRLKFWRSHWLETFKLNTSVEFPHHGAVQDLQFQPGVAEGESPRAVTSGADRKFKVWTVQEEEQDKDGEMDCCWSCEAVGSHQELQAGPLAFATDGSVMCAAFEHALTLWLPEACQLQASLTHPAHRKPIRHLQFGHHGCSHLVVCASESQVLVWNLLTLTLAWTVPLEVTCLAANPRNDHMAVFTKNRYLFVFRPSEEEPLYEQQLPKKCVATAAVYWPYNGRKSHRIFWQQQAQLYFLNQKQELLELGTENEGDDDEEEVVASTALLSGGLGKHHASALSALLAEQSSSAVQEARPPPLWQQQLHASQGSYAQMVCSTPAHMLPPMELIARDLIQEYVHTQCSRDAAMDDGLGETRAADSKTSKKVSNLPNSKASDVVIKEEAPKDLQDILEESMVWVARLFE